MKQGLKRLWPVGMFGLILFLMGQTLGPAPSLTAITCAANQWVNAVTTTNSTCAQPASSNLSDAGAWTPWTPTITCGAGAVGAYSVQVGRYKMLFGKTVFVAATVQAAIGTCSGAITIASFPVAFVNVGNNNQYMTGRDLSTGNELVCGGVVNSSTCTLNTYNNGNPTGSDAVSLSGTYESN